MATPSSNTCAGLRRCLARRRARARCPALQRLLLNGWVKAEWGISENNRRAK
jgi:hypothetical protein